MSCHASLTLSDLSDNWGGLSGHRTHSDHLSSSAPAHLSEKKHGTFGNNKGLCFAHFVLRSHQVSLSTIITKQHNAGSLWRCCLHLHPPDCLLCQACQKNLEKLFTLNQNSYVYARGVWHKLNIIHSSWQSEKKTTLVVSNMSKNSDNLE